MKPSGRLTILLMLAFSFILIAGGHGAGPFLLIQIGLISSLFEKSLFSDWPVSIWLLVLLSITGEGLLLIAFFKKSFHSKVSLLAVCLLVLSWATVLFANTEYKEVTFYTGIPFATLVAVWLWQYCKPKREEEEE
ncbi:hypothetical protein [Phnomibacter sp. MR]|uniref:hypothetical protein n=1 Tax=Phnomibacter sp. MR TaxID=3042318 RepID=UPI003A807EC0